MELQKQLAYEFNLKESYAENIINLIDEGNTIPFIARYRKEMHGACDDQVLRDFADRLNYLRNLNKEKEYTKKRGGNGYKIFTVVTFVIVAVYLAGYLVSFATRPSVRVESVEMGSIMLPATIEGLIIREESVVPSTRSGTPGYFYTDNERVAKNKVICTVEDSGECPPDPRSAGRHLPW